VACTTGLGRFFISGKGEISVALEINRLAAGDYFLNAASLQFNFVELLLRSFASELMHLYSKGN